MFSFTLLVKLLKLFSGGIPKLLHFLSQRDQEVLVPPSAGLYPENLGEHRLFIKLVYMIYVLGSNKEI